MRRSELGSAGLTISTGLSRNGIGKSAWVIGLWYTAAYDACTFILLSEMDTLHLTKIAAMKT